MLLTLLLTTAFADRTLVIEGYRSPSEAAVSASAMFYLPFEVPAGCTSIRVHKEFDHGPDPAQKNTVDLGLFDPRGYGLGGPGFRGWQGGTSDDLVLTGSPETTASWYLAGPIPAGTWHLAQYFLKSTPSGLKYRYTVTLGFDGPKPPSRMPGIPRYAPGKLNDWADWYYGNLHCHSIHSDGGNTFLNLAKLNAAAGFDFMVSTEHNNVTSQYRFAEAAKEVPKLLLIEGDEFTSPYGHAGILGSRPGRWFDFRFDGGQGRLPEVIREAKRDKALFVVNHPAAMCTSCTWRYPESEWKDASGIEVWNGAWDLTDQIAVNLWDRLLREGQRMNAYGGTDYHRGNDPFTPATRVYARSLSRRDVLDGLRAGVTVLTRTAKEPVLEVSVDGKRPGATLSASKSTKVAVRTKVATSCTLLVRGDTGILRSIELSHTSGSQDILIDTSALKFLRLELRQGGEKGPMEAMTNAFFIR